MDNRLSTLVSVGSVGCFVLIAIACMPREYNSGENASTTAAFSATEAGKRGIKEMVYQAPGGVSEKCIIPKHFPGIKYDNSDEKDEADLCSLNFYKAADSSEPGEAVALCPKLSSTFPGIEPYKLAGQEKAKYESQLCKSEDARPTKRIAKFKQSVSCAYTGSILGYYHVSRILGDAGNVPVAVVRTMSADKHLEVAKRGVAWSSDLNNQLWKQVLGYDQNRSGHANYFTADSKQIYGALADDPKNEVKYKEINANSADPAAAKANFLAKAEVGRIYNESPLGAMIKRNLVDAAQVVQQMKDISNLIIMDYLFQQQDRFGNIHRQYYYYWTTKEGGSTKVNDKKTKIDDNGNPTDPKPVPEAIVVYKMLMKDNDCGMREGNPKAFTLGDVQGIRHLSPRTYRGIRYLAQQWQTANAKDFFANETLIGLTDAMGQNPSIDNFGKRIVQAADALTKNCKSGKLLLDLSLEDHIDGKNMPDAVKARCDEILLQQ